MKKAIGETERRRAKQIAHNEAHGITPRSIVKQVRDLIDGVYSEKASKEAEKQELQRAKVEDMSEKDIAKEIKRLEKLMLEHARNLEFEKAARVRDQLALLQGAGLRRRGARQRRAANPGAAGGLEPLRARARSVLPEQIQSGFLVYLTKIVKNNQATQRCKALSCWRGFGVSRGHGRRRTRRSRGCQGCHNG